MESTSFQNFYLINLDEVPLRYLRRWFFLPACKLWRSEDTPACRGNVDMRTAKTFDCTLMKWSLSFEKTFLGGFLHCSMMIKKISLSCPPPHPSPRSPHRLPICCLCVPYSSEIRAPLPPPLISTTLGHLCEDVYPGGKYVRGNIILVLPYLSSVWSVNSSIARWG